MSNEPITIVVFGNPVEWIRENLKDMAVDSVAAVYRSGPINLSFGGTTQYTDKEEDKVYDAWIEDHVRALRQLCELISEQKLFVGTIKNPTSLRDLANWDVEVTDAYFQLIFHKEVIYG